MVTSTLARTVSTGTWRPSWVQTGDLAIAGCDLLDWRVDVNLDAKFDGQAVHGVGDGIDAAARVPDAAGQLDVGDDAEGSRGKVGAGADVGGEPAEQLAQVRRAHGGGWPGPCSAMGRP